jgi:protein O-GlcNAc transferase
LSDQSHIATGATAEELWQMALRCRESGDDAAAVELLRQVADTLPDNPRPWLAIGQIQQTAGDLTSALASFRQAGDIDPFDMTARIAQAAVAEALDRPDDAVAILAEAIDFAPDDVDVRLNYARALTGAGRHEDATAIGLETHSLAPDDKLVNFHLGNLFDDLGQPERACEFYTRAYHVDRDPAVANNLANTMSRTGDTDGAITLIREAISAHPDMPECWHTLGGFLLSKEDFAAAGEAFERVLALSPGDFGGLVGKARVFRFSGDVAAACNVYEQALQQSPDVAMIHAELAMAHLDLNERDAAEAGLRRALALDETRIDDWVTLANILRERKASTEALAAVNRALALDPERAAALVIAADIAYEAADRERAFGLIDKALDIARNDRDIALLVPISGVFERWSESGRALTVIEDILDIEPDNMVARSRQFDLALSLCDWDKYDELCNSRIAELERSLDDGNGLSTDVFNLQALPISYELTARAARIAARRIAHEARKTEASEPLDHAPRRHEKIRVGYLLAYTWQHSLPLVLKELIHRHDRDRFEIYGYSITACAGTDFSRAYRAAFDRFRDIPASRPFTAAKMIHGDEIDILIDVTGLTSLNTMPISSFRPAPVQMHAYGYSITTGADYIDYLITDETYIPPAWEAFGPEKLVYLPGCFLPTKRPETSATYRPTREDCGLPTHGTVFCNFNHPCKFEPTAFAAWMRILQRTPGSALWLGRYFDDTVTSLRRQAERHGIDGERLVFAPLLKHDQHLARLGLADLALDCLHHGGGVTTMDALWTGVPVLTVLGNTPASRLGATLDRAAGIPDLVRPDLDDYVDYAACLASAPTELRALKDKLLSDRLTSPLFDNEAYAHHVDAALAAAWENYCAGHQPRRIVVDNKDRVSFG